MSATRNNNSHLVKIDGLYIRKLSEDQVTLTRNVDLAQRFAMTRLEILRALPTDWRAYRIGGVEAFSQFHQANGIDRVEFE